MSYDPLVWRGDTTLNERFHLYANDEEYDVMQYTGLKDVNYEDIYEGDILSIDYSGYYLEESMKTPHICIMKHELSPLLSGFTLPPFCEVTIIGNIYENPELIPTDYEE